MRKLSRRNALLGALLTAVGPSEAHAEPEPHQAWLEEWRELYVRYETMDDDGRDEEADALYDRMWDLVKLAEAKPADTPRAMAAKIELFRESNFGFDGCYVDPTAANALFDEVIGFVAGA